MIFDFWDVGDEETGDGLAAENTATDDGRLPADGQDVGGIHGADYGWPEDGHGVVDHGSDRCTSYDCDITNVGEQARWDQG